MDVAAVVLPDVPKRDTAYNGWKNRTTWNIMLWLDNDEACYRFYVERVRELTRKGLKITGGRVRLIAMDALGATTPDGCKLTAKCVDWTAIAEAMRESA